MGNFLTASHESTQKSQINISLISRLKTQTMRDVNEAIEIMRDYYPTNSTYDMSSV